MNLSSRLSKRQGPVLLSLDDVQTARRRDGRASWCVWGLMARTDPTCRHWMWHCGTWPVTKTRHMSLVSGPSERWEASGASKGALAGGNGTFLLFGKVITFSVASWGWKVIWALMWFSEGVSHGANIPPTTTHSTKQTKQNEDGSNVDFRGSPALKTGICLPSKTFPKRKALLCQIINWTHFCSQSTKCWNVLRF